MFSWKIELDKSTPGRIRLDGGPLGAIVQTAQTIEALVESGTVDR